jgi:hypothetical protein
MMTSTMGVLMWVMKIVMLAGMVAGGITWTRRRLNVPGLPARARHPATACSHGNAHAPGIRQRTGKPGAAP